MPRPSPPRDPNTPPRGLLWVLLAIVVLLAVAAVLTVWRPR